MTIRPLTIVAGALLVAAGAPDAAQAQYQLQPVRVSSSATAARAAALHADGRQAGDSLDRMKRAAHLHEGSAALRTADDPQRTECLRDAAVLRYFSGDRRRAGRLMESAAASAAQRGDVIAAAQAYSDAAIIAHELKQGARAWDLGVRADVLTGSPLLSEAQRSTLRKQIVQLDRETRVVSIGGTTLAARP